MTVCVVVLFEITDIRISLFSNTLNCQHGTFNLFNKIVY